MTRSASPKCSTLVILSTLCLWFASVALAQPPNAIGDDTLQLREGTIQAFDGTKIPVEHGRLKVPENRSKPDSQAITLAFLRVKSPLDNPGPPVFFLAGGPGGSSIRAVQQFVRGGPQRFMQLIGGDLVGIDQRGVGRSDPNLDSSTSFGLSMEEPGDREKMLAIMQQVCREEAERWRQEGVDLDGYTTAESADDINAVRVALGYEKISLWGGSYGSHLAMATIRRHEPHIARALLVGPEGPDHTLKLPSYTQAGLERLGELVAADSRWGERLPDLVSSVRTILDQLNRETVFVTVDGTRVGISGFDVQRALANRLGLVYATKDIPQLVFDMESGDFTGIARELLDERRTSGIWSAMQMMMDCASGVSPSRAALIAKEAEECLLADAVNFPFGSLADAWAAPDLGESFRGPLRSQVPILFIVGDLDVRTPIRNAEELMADLPNAHLIVVENAGHDTPMGIPELRASWSKFLRGQAISTSRVAAPAVQFTAPKGTVVAAPEGAIPMQRKKLVACVGEYRFENGMVFKIRVGDNRLIGTVPGKGDFDLWPTSETEYFSTNENIPPLTFVIGESGRATSMNGGGAEGKRIR